MKRRLWSLVFAVAGIAGCTQSIPRPDPTAPGAQIPTVEYRSAFAGYMPFRDEPIAPWRGANETVKEAAGHGGHGAESKPAGKEPAKPQPGGAHEGHR